MCRILKLSICYVWSLYGPQWTGIMKSIFVNLLDFWTGGSTDTKNEYIGMVLEVTKNCDIWLSHFYFQDKIIHFYNRCYTRMVPKNKFWTSQIIISMMSAPIGSIRNETKSSNLHPCAPISNLITSDHE